MEDEYLSLAGEARNESPRTKGSRFLASARPVAGATDAEEFVRAVRSEFPGASHHAFAWRLAPRGAEHRSNDDGEPAGSAGLPILQQLEGRELLEVVCVVTRWFGGTKLGIGGLIRAYGGAAAELLNEAALRKVVLTETVEIRFPYTSSGAVEALLHAYSLTAAEKDYGAEVNLAFAVPRSLCAGFLEELCERTGGRATGRVRA